MTKISFFIFFTMMSFLSEAEQVNKKIKKVDAKCHIELYGGAQTLYFRTIKLENLDKLAKKIINRSVLTTLSSKKQKIYKVYECVLLKDTFKASSSKQVDERTAR
ncbi:MAG: RPA family protein [Alteromonadaceae bacterium]|jgi:RPA family protein